MKKVISLCFCISLFLVSAGQIISVSVDANNTFYKGLDNSLTVAVENCSARSISVKTNNGTITGSLGSYMIHPSQIGKTEISIYKRIDGKVKKIGVSDFRVIRIPDAVFRIGSLSNNFGRIRIVELQNQSFVRAEVECCGFDLKINVDSFTVCLITREPCTYKELSNTGNEIKKELKSEFQKLKKDDLVIFKNIYATGPNGSSLLAPVIVTVF